MNPDAAAPSDQSSSAAASEPPANAGPVDTQTRVGLAGAPASTAAAVAVAADPTTAAAGVAAQTGERRVTVDGPVLQVGSDDATVVAPPLPIPQTAPANIPAPVVVAQTSSAPPAAPAPTQSTPAPATRTPIPAVVSIGAGSTVNWQSLVNGLAGEAQSAWQAVLGEIPTLAADPDEAEELQFALAELVAVGAAHIGLSVDDEERLRRRYLTARAIVSNNAAVKAKEAEAFVLQTVGRIFARATDLVVYGISRAGVAAAVSAL